MQIIFAKSFEKQFSKQPKKIQNAYYNRLTIFVADPTNKQLRNHPLQGKYKGFWSINVTGDVRALYQKEGDTIIVFALIGTHSQLY